jgi:hypothetical protein
MGKDVDIYTYKKGACAGTGKRARLCCLRSWERPVTRPRATEKGVGWGLRNYYYIGNYYVQDTYGLTFSVAHWRVTRWISALAASTSTDKLWTSGRVNASSASTSSNCVIWPPLTSRTSLPVRRKLLFIWDVIKYIGRYYLHRKSLRFGRWTLNPKP